MLPRSVVLELWVRVGRFLQAVARILGRVNVEVLCEVGAIEFPYYLGCIQPGDCGFFVDLTPELDAELLRLFLVLVVPIFLADLSELLGDAILQQRYVLE